MVLMTLINYAQAEWRCVNVRCDLSSPTREFYSESTVSKNASVENTRNSRVRYSSREITIYEVLKKIC